MRKDVPCPWLLTISILLKSKSPASRTREAQNGRGGETRKRGKWAENDKNRRFSEKTGGIACPPLFRRAFPACLISEIWHFFGVEPHSRCLLKSGNFAAAPPTLPHRWYSTPTYSIMMCKLIAHLRLRWNRRSHYSTSWQNHLLILIFQL